MDIQQLKCFLSVAKYHNFTKASEHLYIGQPALSRQIFDLEKQLGVKLFIRNNRSVTLTPAGEVLKQEGERLIQHIDRVIEKTKKAAEGILGHLRVAMVGYFNKTITQFIQRFMAEYSNIKLELDQLEAVSLNNAVLSGDCDIGISYKFAITNPDEVEQEEIFQEKFWIIAPKNSAIFEKQKVSFTDLMNEKIILPDGPPPYFLKPLFHEYNVLTKGKTSCPIIPAVSPESMFLQVKAGMGISVVPGFAVTDLKNSEDLRILDIDGVDMVQQVVMFWKKDSQNPACKNFRRLVREFVCSEKNMVRST